MALVMKHKCMPSPDKLALWVITSGQGASRRVLYSIQIEPDMQWPSTSRLQAPQAPFPSPRIAPARVPVAVLLVELLYKQSYCRTRALSDWTLGILYGSDMLVFHLILSTAASPLSAASTV